jgi:diguanylate cyclase (GGDEF)-like protein/PAS domain S-box-containing protein
MEHGLQIIHPDDQTTAVNHVQQALEQRATYDIEKRIVRPDGSIRWVHSVGAVICDEHQQPVTLSGSFLDITERKQAEEAVQRQWQFLRQVIDSIPAFIFARDHDGRFTLVNQTMADVYGTTVEALLGKTDADMHLDAQELERIRQEDRQVIDTGTELVIPERHIKDAHGRNRYFSVVKRLLTLPDDTADQVLVVGADITERKQAEEALRTSEQRLQAIFDNAAVGIGLADKTGQSILANARGAQQLGYTPEELAQYSNLELTHPDDRAQTVERMQQLVHGEIQGYRIEKRYLRKDGSIFWADLSVSAVYDDDGLITYLLGIVVDITERKQLEHQLQHVNMLLQEQAIRDPLTGLHNRRYLDETLPRELQRAERAGQPVGVIMLDIDHFKRFNDTYGHDAGDALLQTMGTFLQRNTRGDDIACRYGGEEFTLVLPGASLADARQRAEELREGIQSLSVEHQGQPLGAVTASLGVAVFAAHGTTTDALVRAADQALYQAKRNGRNRVEVVTIPLSEECHIDIVK